MVLIIKPELNFLRWFDFSETMKVILIFFINHVAEKKSEEKSHREKRKEARLEKKAKKYQALLQQQVKEFVVVLLLSFLPYLFLFLIFFFGISVNLCGCSFFCVM